MTPIHHTFEQLMPEIEVVKIFWLVGLIGSLLSLLFGSVDLVNKRVDILLVISVLTLSIFGLIMIYSASYVWSEYKFNTPYKFVRNQGTFFFNCSNYYVYS